MTVPNHEHLFEQAERLATPSSVGQPRQVDLRRAISSAYYGIFHFTLAALADEIVGPTQRLSARYGLVYRSVDHRGLKELCAEVGKPKPSVRYSSHIPASGFDPIIKALATAVRDLQDERHRADYDPMARFFVKDALLAVATARSAVRPFYRAESQHRTMFLTLLLCPPR